MPWVKCPHCGEFSYTDEVYEFPPPEVIAKLSPVAYAILANAAVLPLTFKRGQPVSLRVLADLVGYHSKTHIRRGLLELAEHGFIQKQPYGHRYRYAGTPRLSHLVA